MVLETKIIILSALVQKVMTKNMFPRNGGKHNVPINEIRTDH